MKLNAGLRTRSLFVTVAAALSALAFTATRDTDPPAAPSPPDTVAAALVTDEVEGESEREADGDMEPVDPAEQRPQLQPPERPVARGGGAWVQLGPAPTQSAQVAVPPDNDHLIADAAAGHPVVPKTH